MKLKFSESRLSVFPSLKQWHFITAENVFVPAPHSGLWYYIALKIWWWEVQMGWFIKWTAHFMLQVSDSSVTPVSECSNRCISMKHLANILKDYCLQELPVSDPQWAVPGDNSCIAIWIWNALGWGFELQWVLLPSALVCPYIPSTRHIWCCRSQGGCRGGVSPMSLSLMNEPLGYLLQ